MLSISKLFKKSSKFY